MGRLRTTSHRSERSPPMANPETSNWLDGPKFTEFLDRQGMKPHWTDASLSRAYRRWRSGTAASLALADTILTIHGLTLNDVPHGCWAQPPLAHPRREEGIMRFSNGETPREIAEDLGVAAYTVRRWAHDALTNARSLSDIRRTM
jgi:hypothetical protein